MGQTLQYSVCPGRAEFCLSWPDFIRLQATPFITFSIQIQENVTNLVNNFILKEINKKIIRKLGIYNEYTINVWRALCRTSQRKHKVQYRAGCHCGSGMCWALSSFRIQGGSVSRAARGGHSLLRGDAIYSGATSKKGTNRCL